ncbi:MAG: hypothetical protein IJJ22_01300 [Oscillospiraceae bacterium]|nr:hypothetical protein [Oscillospiraceae bacterium]
MNKPVLWTVACVLVIIAAAVRGWMATSTGLILVALAVLCAVLQWLAWFKRKK